MKTIELIDFDGDLMIPRKFLKPTQKRRYVAGAHLMICENEMDGFIITWPTKNKSNVRKALQEARDYCGLINKKHNQAMLPNGELVNF